MSVGVTTDQKQTKQQNTKLRILEPIKSRDEKTEVSKIKEFAKSRV
jgi:hypothetical protein